MYSWKIIHGKHKRIALQSLINSHYDRGKDIHCGVQNHAFEPVFLLSVREENFIHECSIFMLNHPVGRAVTSD